MSGTERPERSQSSYDLRGAFAARDGREAAELYDSWAEDYERSVSSWGYTTPAVAAGLVGRYVERGGGAILDAGAGTGITGEILALLGYRELVGIDVSGDMLELARRKGVYGELRLMELGGPLDFPDDAFDAVVSTGTFAAGHAPPDSFDELVRATGPGGHIIASIRTDVYVDGGFEAKQEALEEDGKWRLVETSDVFSHLRFEDPELKIRVYAYEVL